MFKRIVVTLDASHVANKALKKAVELAKIHKSSLRLIHVIDYGGLVFGAEGVNVESLYHSLKKNGKEAINHAYEYAEKHGVKAQKKLLECKNLSSDIPSRIVSDATKWRADLLVMGTHGHQGMKRLILGSIADGVIREAKMPVLIVRNNGRRSRK